MGGYNDYITRGIEEIVQKSDSTFKCVLVTGARQTGKSTMLKKLFADRKYVCFNDLFIVEQDRENPHIFIKHPYLKRELANKINRRK
ncbi:MAG: AAA family ATPase [Candidatus Coproplasma sp.]